MNIKIFKDETLVIHQWKSERGCFELSEEYRDEEYSG
jgi:hypothetical protein